MSLRPRTLVPVLATLFGVVVAAALTLKAMDRFPPRDVERPRTFSTLPEVERAAGTRLALPAYYPQTLGWPPARIQTAGTRPSAVLLTLADRASGAERFLFAQTLGGSRNIPPGLLANGVSLAEDSVSLRNGEEGRFRRLLLPDGTHWLEVSWEKQGRLHVMRTNGAREELLRLAGSVRREGH